MVHNLLNVANAKRFIPYQMLENKQMLNDLLDTPNDKLKHIRCVSLSFFCTVMLIVFADATRML